ncbi:hypothetical protein BDV25DRAFT_42274 [Aspergillus avenaceus]|uniref:GPI anchored protein n=1 Tax=Aspergillus avenaceus TaxID=36643 RepID=A0A5N6U3H1_ASPAV|nr:hypothetical protein BDV25DRAFT_42274 [Aspergillus avenaceus]
MQISIKSTAILLALLGSSVVHGTNLQQRQDFSSTDLGEATPTESGSVSASESATESASLPFFTGSGTDVPTPTQSGETGIPTSGSASPTGSSSGVSSSSAPTSGSASGTTSSDASTSTSTSTATETTSDSSSSSSGSSTGTSTSASASPSETDSGASALTYGGLLVVPAILGFAL